MGYNEEDYLLISGLQHFAFCRRQWALIHIENQWEENYWTTDGKVIHDKAHDASFFESRRNLLVQRALRVHSSKLGVTGACDVVEFHRSDNGISLANRDGKWSVFPVEYKRGRSGKTDGDSLQLCCQAMCLEEMLCCDISSGALYYAQTHHREQIEFSAQLRERVMDLLDQMHELFLRRYTPKEVLGEKCGSCSLNEICLPKLKRIRSVDQYIEEVLKEK